MSDLQDYMEYKRLHWKFTGTPLTDSPDGFDQFEQDFTEKGMMRQLCIKLTVLEMAEFSAVCSILSDNKQTFGRFALMSGASYAREVMEKQGIDVESVKLRFLQQDGFTLADRGEHKVVVPLADSTKLPKSDKAA